jgi:cell division protein FtsB
VQAKKMTSKQQVVLWIAVLALFSMLVFILFGDHGFADLNFLKSEKEQLIKKNAMLARENLILYDTINRLKNDPVFIENVARRDLGMIGKDELIVKPRPSKSSP